MIYLVSVQPFSAHSSMHFDEIVDVSSHWYRVLFVEVMREREGVSDYPALIEYDEVVTKGFCTTAVLSYSYLFAPPWFELKAAYFERFSSDPAEPNGWKDFDEWKTVFRRGILFILHCWLIHWESWHSDQISKQSLRECFPTSELLVLWFVYRLNHHLLISRQQLVEPLANLVGQPTEDWFSNEWNELLRDYSDLLVVGWWVLEGIDRLVAYSCNFGAQTTWFQFESW